MSDEAVRIGDIEDVLLEPFDNGQRCVVYAKLKKPCEINGRTSSGPGFVMEEHHIQQLVEGLERVASAREAMSILLTPRGSGKIITSG